MKIKDRRFATKKKKEEKKETRGTEKGKSGDSEEIFWFRHLLPPTSSLLGSLHLISSHLLSPLNLLGF